MAFIFFWFHTESLQVELPRMQWSTSMNGASIRAKIFSLVFCPNFHVDSNSRYTNMSQKMKMSNRFFSLYTSMFAVQFRVTHLHLRAYNQHINGILMTSMRIPRQHCCWVDLLSMDKEIRCVEQTNQTSESLISMMGHSYALKQSRPEE